MKKNIWFAILFLAGMSCSTQPEVLYQSGNYTIYTDSVVQGDYVARVISANRIISNYKSPASENYSRLITFKFSINEKDNEMPSGTDHWLIIDDEQMSPIIKFGQENAPIPSDPGTKLPVNFAFRFRVDLREVISQFEEKGYYQTFDGSLIAREDFKAVYIAGSAEPLSWDFSNLDENKLELKDTDKDGIYELELVLNPFDQSEVEDKEWNLSTDISAKPSYHSDQMIVDALFNLSLEEAIKNIESDSTLRTGEKWGGVWTRDVSYSTLLAFAYHEPEIAKISLLKKIKRNRIIQDTGSGGAWPVSSDRTIWAIAAWEIYKFTGDEEWLKMAYHIIKNSLEDDFKTLVSRKTGMIRGESSFLDWREQTYPKWMSNTDIFVSENLGTNVVHYQAHIILAEMAKILGEPYDVYLNRAETIKLGINESLWIPEKGYYGQYLYGRLSLNLSPKFEALGESLAIIFDVADEKQAKSIIENTPITPFGVSCIFPQIPGISPYHNNAIWPFVQSYWNLAAAKVGNERALNQGLASIYRAGALFLSNYENFVAESGDFTGTEINSSRMLWSMAGNLAMVHRVFIGMSFEPDGINFHPVIPKTYGGKKILHNFKYRNAILDIEVEGYGNEISLILLDGEPLDKAFFADTIRGKHQIKILMMNNDFSKETINLVKNEFSLSNPQTKLIPSHITWEEVPGAVSYNLYKNGILLNMTMESSESINENEFAEYKVTAINKDGNESFSSEPIMVYSNSDLWKIEAEDFADKSDLPYSNYSGNGFVEISPLKNRSIKIEINIESSGTYYFDCKYANGTGPWNTDNNCAIRSLYVNGDYEGVFVFPQRGSDEWSDWGYSNSFFIDLKKGENQFEVILKDWNNNMDGEINDALLDFFRLIKRNGI